MFQTDGCASFNWNNKLVMIIIANSVITVLHGDWRDNASPPIRGDASPTYVHRIAITFSPLTSAKRLQFDKRSMAFSILFSLMFLNFAS